MGYAVIAGKYHATGHIHRFNRTFQPTAQQPELTVIDIEPMAGKIDQQLFNAPHGIEQTLDRVLHFRHGHRPVLVGNECHVVGRKALGQHPITHPLGASHGIIQCWQTPHAVHPDQYRSTVHPSSPHNWLPCILSPGSRKG